MHRLVPIQRRPLGVDHAAEQALTHGDVDDAAGAAHLLAGFDAAPLVEQDHGDLVRLEVQRDAELAAGKTHQLLGADVGQPFDAGDALADKADRAGFPEVQLGLLTAERRHRRCRKRSRGSLRALRFLVRVIFRHSSSPPEKASDRFSSSVSR